MRIGRSCVHTDLHPAAFLTSLHSHPEMRYALFFFVVSAAFLSACGDFNKAMKSKDIGLKMAVAEKYSAKPDYDRALPLLEELLSLTRGDTLFERVSYLYAKSNFGMKDYILASYYLENFAKTFPNSRWAEECSFLSAYCHYKESPEYELDQGDTQAAIDQLQLFMVRFPQTSLKDSCNTLIDGLRIKLEKKDYWGAELYVKTRNYAGASIALRNFMKAWPNSQYREDVLFDILLCDHDLALNSVESKKLARAEEGIRSFDTFADAFPESGRLNDAQRLKEDLQALIERLKRLPTP